MDMLDFICNGSIDLFGTGRERKIQKENICLQRHSNPHPASPRQESQRLRPLGHEGLMVIILNFSLPLRSEQVSGAHVNEIKHDHSPEVIVVLDSRYD